MNNNRMSPGILLIICCVICSIFTSIANFCPGDSKETCLQIAGFINCIICIYFLLKFFNIM